jgi:hypothetical protein
MLTYFDKKMPVSCLYRFEAWQYHAWCSEPSITAAVGGASAEDFIMPQHAYARHWPAEMLLRLLVLLPDIFHSERNFTPQDAEFINSTLGGFVAWLAKHWRALFTPAQARYAPAAEAYVAEVNRVLDRKKQEALKHFALADCYSKGAQ